ADLVLVALSGSAVDQVEVDVFEPCSPRPLHALFRPSGGVSALEDLQYVLPGALHAKGDAGETGLTQTYQMVGVDRLGVGLGGQFRIGQQTETVPDLRHDAAEVLRRQQGGGAPTHEHGVDGGAWPGQYPVGQGDLADGLFGVSVPRSGHAAVS